MFIKYEHIKDEVLIDCRTEKEFRSMPLFDKNIPIINENEHLIIKRFYPCALFVITYGLIKRRKYIKKKLIEYSSGGEKKVIIACSRGRLRSPIMYLYAKYLNIDAKVLSRGIRRFFINDGKFIRD